jgi:hypothetical protein
VETLRLYGAGSLVALPLALAACDSNGGGGGGSRGDGGVFSATSRQTKVSFLLGARILFRSPYRLEGRRSGERIEGDREECLVPRCEPPKRAGILGLPFRPFRRRE